MRHLDRSAVSVPACLGRFNPAEDTWGAVTEADKQEIRAQLGMLQNNHCAYCEVDISKENSKPHIEHFEQRSRKPHKTFLWDNLFWSCTHNETCGKHNDKVVKTYKQPGVLLKPDVDDPRKYLVFGKKGEVEPRAGLDAAQVNRARETIRVFALDDGRLVQMRKAYSSGPTGSLEELYASGFSPEEALPFVQDLVELYAKQPFSSAALDALGFAP